MSGPRKKSASRTKPIRLPDQSPGARRYQTPRAWGVAGLAASAAIGTVMLTGAVSITLSEVSKPAAVSAPAQAGWRVQVGTFERREVAEAHMRGLADGLPELAHRSLSVEPLGALVRARIGGFPDGGAATRACVTISQGGGDCFVIEPGR